MPINFMASLLFFSENSPQKKIALPPAKGNLDAALQSAIKEIVSYSMYSMSPDGFGPALVALAKAVDNQDFCKLFADETFSTLHDLLSCLTQGTTLQLNRETLFSNFHILRQDTDFLDIITGIVLKFSSGEHHDIVPIFVQTLLDSIIEQYVLGLNTAPVPTQNDTTFTKNDQGVLFYIAGFIISAMLKRYTSSDVDLHARFTQNMHESASNVFTEHRSWINKCDRGGLQHPSDTFYQMIRQMEFVLRSRVDLHNLSATSVMKDSVQEMILDDFQVKQHWDQCSSGLPPSTSLKLLHFIINTFQNVRGKAIEKLKLRQLQKSLKSTKQHKKQRKSSLRGSLR